MPHTPGACPPCGQPVSLLPRASVPRRFPCTVMHSDIHLPTPRCASCKTQWPAWSQYDSRLEMSARFEEDPCQTTTVTWPFDLRGCDVVPKARYRYDWTNIHPRWHPCGVLNCPAGLPLCSYCTAWEPKIRAYACAACTYKTDRQGYTRLLRHIVHISKPRPLDRPLALLQPRGDLTEEHIPPRLDDDPDLWYRPVAEGDPVLNLSAIDLEDERRKPKACGRPARNGSWYDGPFYRCTGPRPCHQHGRVGCQVF